MKSITRTFTENFIRPSRVQDVERTRQSPDSEKVSEYLRSRTDNVVSFSPSDKLCKGCYDMYLAIL